MFTYASLISKITFPVCQVYFVKSNEQIQIKSDIQIFEYMGEMHKKNIYIYIKDRDII